MSATKQSQPCDERAAFETWWSKTMNVAEMDLHRNNYPMTPPELQPYACHETQRAWLAWQERAEYGAVQPAAGVEPIAYRVPSGTAHAMRIKRYQDAASFGGDKKKLHEAAEKFGWKPLFAAPVSAEPVEMDTLFVAGAICRHLDTVLDQSKAMAAARTIAHQIPTAPDLEYLRDAAENTALPAFLRGQIAAAVKALEDQAQQPVSGADQFRDSAQMIEPSGNSGELPHLPLNDPAAAYRVLYEYGQSCARAALTQQDADKVDALNESYQRGLRDGRREGDGFIKGCLA